MKNTPKTLWLAFCLMLPFAQVSAQADILDSWYWRNPITNPIPPITFSNAMQNVCFGGGQFVAVGSNGVIQTSSDGKLWNASPEPLVSYALNRVIYANGQFMAVGNHGTILTSTNGVNWSKQSSGATADLLAVTYGNGRYVVVGALGRVGVSTNGTTWSWTSAGTSDLNWITFGNGLFMLPATTVIHWSSGGQLQVRVSSDALNWTTENLPGLSQVYYHYLCQGEFGNGVFLAVIVDESVGYKGLNVGQSHHLYQSLDGTNWIQGILGSALPTSPYSHQFLTFANGLFYELAGAYFTSAANSSTCASSLAPTNAANAKYMAYGNGCYVLIASDANCWTSTDPTSWIDPNAPPASMLSDVYQITASTNNYVVLANSQPVLVSPDGLVFSAVTNTPSGMQAVAFDGTNYVGVGGTSVYVSTNATAWVPRTSNASLALNAVCRGATGWVAVGISGTIISSPNASTWTLRISGAVDTFNSVAFGNGIYLAVGNSGAIITSPNGTTWDLQDAGTAVNLYCVRFVNGQFVAVGQGGIILTSPDGITWSSVTSGTTALLTSVAYGDGRFVVCGTGVVLASTNGVNWQNISAKVPYVPNASSIAFLNQSFWIVGSGGTILQSDSTDGIPRLNGSLLPANGGFRLKIPLNVPHQYRIQTSTNFANWRDLVAITNGPLPAVWDDTNATKAPVGFYRIATP